MAVARQTRSLSVRRDDVVGGDPLDEAEPFHVPEVVAAGRRRRIRNCGALGGGVLAGSQQEVQQLHAHRVAERGEDPQVGDLGALLLHVQAFCSGSNT